MPAPNPMDIVNVDVNGEDLFGASAIQLPPGVGELIPNLLFIGPHGTCEEMVRRFGVRYLIDVLEDKEVVSTVQELGYASKMTALTKELEEVRKKIRELERLVAERQGMGEEDTDAEEGEDENDEKAADSGIVATTEDADDDDDQPLPEVAADSHTGNPTKDSSAAALSLDDALHVKKAYLQIVADLRTYTQQLQTLERHEKTYQDAIKAITSLESGDEEEVATEGTTDSQGTTVAADKRPATSALLPSSAGLTVDGKKKSDYIRYQDCSVVAPITATEGYVVAYPKDLHLMHFNMRDALVEDLTVALNMGVAKKRVDTDGKRAKKACAGGSEDECDGGVPKPSSGPSAVDRGMNDFVTMEEMLEEYPPPQYQPPYALVDYIDEVLKQNPSERDLTALATSALQRKAAAFKEQMNSQNDNPANVAVSNTSSEDEPTITRHAVYIYCYAGKSRSATIAAAYSMISQLAGNKQLDEVMELLSYMTPVTVKRPQGYVVRKGQGCRPNPRFMRDLMAMEAQVQTNLQATSGIPSSRRRPFETSFDIDVFNCEGLVELFCYSPPNPNAQIPENVVIDTYEKVCQGDVIKARRLLVAEQTRLLISPKVRQEMIADNVERVLAQDVDYYMLERQKISDEYEATMTAATRGVSADDEGNTNAISTIQNTKVAADERKKLLDARLKSLKVATPRHVIMQVLEEQEFDETAALRKLRLLREAKVKQHMRS